MASALTWIIAATQMERRGERETKEGRGEKGSERKWILKKKKISGIGASDTHTQGREGSALLIAGG
jgi:hypothetical protein